MFNFKWTLSEYIQSQLDSYLHCWSWINTGLFTVAFRLAAVILAGPNPIFVVDLIFSVIPLLSQLSLIDHLRIRGPISAVC